MFLLQLLTYFSILIFVVIIIGKLVRYASAPVHLRWELYPVAHEAEKAKYGGSYYEELNFWEKNIKKSHIKELMEMFEEILFLKGIFTHNRPLWVFSFPFHFGMYLLSGAFFLMILGAIFQIAGTEITANSSGIISTIIYHATIIMGYGGIILTIMGSIGLFIKRLTDKGLKLYNSPIDYINLIFLAVVAASLLFNGLKTDFSLNRAYIVSLITFDSSIQIGTGYMWHVILSALLFIYLPLTRMTHFVAKYFTYHKVRWDDEPNLKGSKLQIKIKEALNYGVSWSAPHMKTGKTWAEVATNLPPEAKNEN